ERYGGVLLGTDGRVTGFVRRGPSAAGSFHYIGVQLAQQATFDGIRAGEPARSIGGVYDTLMTAQPGSVQGFVCDAEFWDVGTADGIQLRERIDQYLRVTGLGGPNARVVPLTGDASDRRYFRIIPAEGPSVVLALHTAAIDFASLPFANVAELLRLIPLPVPDV